MDKRNHSISLPKEIALKLPVLVKASGFKNKSKYIASLISRDFDGVLARHLKPEEMLSEISAIGSALNHQNSDLSASRCELLQRIYILTKIVVELYFKLVSSQTSPEQMQAKLDQFITEAKEQYPLPERLPR